MKGGVLLVAAIATRLAAQDSTASLVDRAAQEYRAARNIRAGFEQTLTSPATCGHDDEPLLAVQLVPGVLARGANSEPKSTPDEAVESLETIVLLTMFTARASWSETPAPSQPATLLEMMLLVTVTVFQAQSEKSKHERIPLGKLTTSVPLTCCKRRPPPLPLSAALPRMRLALITRPGPVPSLGGIVAGSGTQSLSVVTPQVRIGGSGAPMTSTPPPLVVMDGFVLWLNRIALCAMVPFLLKPM